MHFSCAGVDFENYQADEKEPFICRWCRAEGVSLNEAKKEKKEEKKEKAKPRAKKERERAVGEVRNRGRIVLRRVPA